MDDNQTQPTEEQPTQSAGDANGVAQAEPQKAQEPAAQSAPDVSAPESPAEPTSEAPAQPEAAATSAAPEAPSAPSGPVDAKKMFYKTFSPRIFNMPLSFVIDKNRAKMAAVKKGYTAPDNGLVLDSGNMFWGEVLVEVQNAKPEDSNVVDLTQKEIMTGATQAEIEQKAGKKATKVYTAHQGTSTQVVAVF